MCSRIAPLCLHHYAVKQFVRLYSSLEQNSAAGLVNHALVSAIETLLEDYAVLLLQLEQKQNKGDLNLSV